VQTNARDDLYRCTKYFWECCTVWTNSSVIQSFGLGPTNVWLRTTTFDMVIHVERELVFKRSATPSPLWGQALALTNLGVSFYLRVHPLSKTTKFGVVTHVGACILGSATSPIPRERSSRLFNLGVLLQTLLPCARPDWMMRAIHSLGKVSPPTPNVSMELACYPYHAVKSIARNSCCNQRTTHDTPSASYQSRFITIICASAVVIYYEEALYQVYAPTYIHT